MPYWKGSKYFVQCPTIKSYLLKQKFVQSILSQPITVIPIHLLSVDFLIIFRSTIAIFKPTTYHIELSSKVEKPENARTWPHQRTLTVRLVSSWDWFGFRCFKTTKFYRWVKSDPVKLKTSHTVNIIPECFLAALHWSPIQTTTHVTTSKHQAGNDPCDHIQASSR